MEGPAPEKEVSDATIVTCSCPAESMAPRSRTIQSGSDARSFLAVGETVILLTSPPHPY